MDKFSYKKALKFLEDKEKKRESSLNKRYKKAKKDFQKIVEHIISNYNPRRIYQWGSLIERKNFSESSDLDIAVEGITSAENFFKLYGEIMKMTEFSIDLVQIEKIEKEYAEIIKLKGKLIYDRGEKNIHSKE